MKNMSPVVYVERNNRRKIRRLYDKGYLFKGIEGDKVKLELPYFIKEGRIITEEDIE